MIVLAFALALGLLGAIVAIMYLALHMVSVGDAASAMIIKLREELDQRTVDGERATFERDRARETLAWEQARAIKLEKVIDDVIKDHGNEDLAPSDVASRISRLSARWDGNDWDMSEASDGGPVRPNDKRDVSAPSAAVAAGLTTVLK